MLLSSERSPATILKRLRNFPLIYDLALHLDGTKCRLNKWIVFCKPCDVCKTSIRICRRSFKQDGSKAPAHSAVVASIPYFRTRLKDDWSGPGWTLTKKLELSLPCPVTRDAVEAFLKYAYGGAWSLRQLSPTDASMMQVRIEDYRRDYKTLSTALSVDVLDDAQLLPIGTRFGVAFLAIFSRILEHAV